MTPSTPPSELFADWPPLSTDSAERLAGELEGMVSPERLAQFRSVVVRGAAAQSAPRLEPPAQRFLAPPTLDLTGKPGGPPLEALRSRGLEIAAETAFVIAAAGGGTRLAQSVPESERPRLLRAGKLTKPTFPVAPVSGKSALCLTLEALTLLQERASIGAMPVWVVVSEETRAAVLGDIERNCRTIDLPGLRLLGQAENPTFSPDGCVLTTCDPATGEPRIHTSASGTLGVLRALGDTHGEEATPLELARDLGKSRFAFLYADDALLNRAGLLSAVLGAAEETALLLIGVEKDGLHDPPGGTIHCRQRDGGPAELCITELSTRSPSLDEAESQHHAEHGRHFPFNTGAMVMGQALVHQALDEWTAPMHVVERAETLVSGAGEAAERREVTALKVEEFLTDIVEVANESHAQSAVALCLRKDYGAIKDSGKVQRYSGWISKDSAEWLADRGVRVAAFAEVSEASELVAADEVQIADGVDVEVDGSIHIGERLSVRGKGALRLLGSIDIEDDVTLELAGTMLFVGEGDEPLVVGAGATVRAVGEGAQPSVVAITGSVAPGAAIEVSGTCVNEAAPPQTFLPPGELDATSVAEHLAPANMVRSVSGVRADYGETDSLSFEHRLIAAADAYAFAHCVADHLPDRPLKIVLGHDPRPTSVALIDSHVRGLLAAANGLERDIEIANLGRIATPVFEEAVRELEADGGIMVTASHCPVCQNGSKYTCGAVDAEGSRHPLAGALLPAEEMAELTTQSERLIGDLCDGDPSLLNSLNAVTEADVSRALGRHPECRQRALEAFDESLRRQLALTDASALASFRETASQAKLVLDPNGGTACGTGADALRSLGFAVHEINATVGKPAHSIEPSEEALADVVAAMASGAAPVGGVMDWDADRLTWAARNQHGAASAAGPQQVAAFNVAMWLSWLDLRGELSGRRVAIVAHGPTSGAVDEIATHFGTEVVRVETGEMNLVARMAELRSEGWLAALGVEGANGGTIFGEDTCRNGFLTLAVAGMVAADPALVCRWLERSGQWAQLDSDTRDRFSSGDYALHDVIDSLPTYHTLASKASAESAPTRARWQGDLKEVFFSHFIDKVWRQPEPQRRRLCGLSPDRNYDSYRQVNYENTREVPERTGDHSGGYKIELTDGGGNRSFLWLRFSRTEPSQCRLIVDSRFEEEAQALTQVGLDILRRAMTEVS